MAEINFPSTDGKPTDGSFKFVFDGVVYVWDGEKWTGELAADGGSERVGNLQEVTDLGNTTSNGITAAGTSDLGGNIENGSGTRIWQGGNVYVRNDLAQPQSIYKIFKGSYDQAGTTYDVRSDGSITAAGGSVNIGAWNSSFITPQSGQYNIDNQATFTIGFQNANATYPDGVLRVVSNTQQNVNPNGATPIQTWYGGTDETAAPTEVASIDHTGSITSKSYTVSKDNINTFKVTPTSLEAGIDVDTWSNFSVDFTDGSITAAGNITLGQNPAGDTASIGVFASSDGYVRARNDNVDGNVFIGYGGSQNDPTSFIGADGSASFGNATFTGPGTNLLPSGGCYVQATSGSTDTAFQVVNPDDINKPKVSIKHDGSALFGGSVSSQNNATEGCFFFPDGAAEGMKGGTQKWYLADSGDAVFAGTVEASNISNFKTRLKSALLEAADMNSVKTAILEALEQL